MENIKTCHILKRQILSGISELAYICDIEGSLDYVNEAFERYTGRKPEEFHGKPAIALFESAELEKIKDFFRRAVKGESAGYEARLRSGILCEFRNFPLKDARGRVTGVLTIAKNITERRRTEDELESYRNHLELLVQARTVELIKTNEMLLQEILERERIEQELKESEERYRSLLELADNAVFIAGADDGIIIYANKKAEKLIGRPVKDIIGRHQSELHPRDDAASYSSLFREHVSRKGLTSGDNMFVWHTEGRKIPVEISSSVSVIQGRKVIYGIFRDLSAKNSYPLIL